MENDDGLAGMGEEKKGGIKKKSTKARGGGRGRGEVEGKGSPGGKRGERQEGGIVKERHTRTGGHQC